MKTIKLTSEPCLKGYDGAFLRFVSEDGEELSTGIWDYWYQATAQDKAGEEYRVVWALRNSYDMDCGDETKACDWDYPDQITDEQGRNVTDKVKLIL